MCLFSQNVTYCERILPLDIDIIHNILINATEQSNEYIFSVSVIIQLSDVAERYPDLLYPIVDSFYQYIKRTPKKYQTNESRVLNEQLSFSELSFFSEITDSNIVKKYIKTLSYLW